MKEIISFFQILKIFWTKVCICLDITENKINCICIELCINLIKYL